MKLTPYILLRRRLHTTWQNSAPSAYQLHFRQVLGFSDEMSILLPKHHLKTWFAWRHGIFKKTLSFFIPPSSISIFVILSVLCKFYSTCIMTLANWRYFKSISFSPSYIFSKFAWRFDKACFLNNNRFKQLLPSAW